MCFPWPSADCVTKNIVWTFALFWYQLFNSFDGSYLFEYTYILLYNLAFTSVPVILMGILDQDVDDKVSLAVPQLYRRGILRLEWTQLKFWVYMIDGIYQSVICFFMAYLVFYTGAFAGPTGQDLGGREQMGVFVACAAIVVVNSYVLINQYRWDWLFVLVIAISTLLVFLWTGIYSQFKSVGSFYSAAEQVFGALSFWATTAITVMICLLPRMASKIVQKLFFPRDIDVIREQVRDGKFDYLYNKPTESTLAASSISSEIVKPPTQTFEQDDELRPIYPPSVAPTATTTGKRASGNGSNGSDGSGFPGGEGTFTPRRFSLERHRPSMDRARPSFDRLRSSMDGRPRASFEATNDFTSAAMLARMESCALAPKRTSMAVEVPR